MVNVDFGEGIPFCPVCEEPIDYVQFKPRCDECKRKFHNGCGLVEENYACCDSCSQRNLRSNDSR